MFDFNIYIERLRDGKVEKFEVTIPPDFLEIHERELSFHHPVLIKGSAYLADSALILQWECETLATLLCSICNENVTSPLRIMSAIYSEELANISSGVFNFKGLLRDSLLLELPLRTECNDGSCSERESLKKYLR